MTPEEAGIYSADTHMRNLVNWCIDTETREFTLKDLPEQFCKKWHSKNVYAGNLERVRFGPKGVTVWRIGGTYEAAVKAVSKMENGAQLNDTFLTLDTLKALIRNGISAPIEIAKALGRSQSATYKALKKYYDAGKLGRTIENRHLSYTIIGG